MNFWRTIRFTETLFFVSIFTVTLSQSTSANSSKSWQGVIVHHTDTANGRNFTVAECNVRHSLRGWNGCGYNFLIQPDGRIDSARGWDKPGAHCKNHNSTHLGVAIVGTGQITSAQRQAFKSFILRVWRTYGKIAVLPHGQKYGGFGNTECPTQMVWNAVKGIVNESSAEIRKYNFDETRSSIVVGNQNGNVARVGFAHQVHGA